MSIINLLLVNPQILDTMYIYFNYELDAVAETVLAHKEGHLILSGKTQKTVCLVDSKAGKNGVHYTVPASILNESVFQELQNQLWRLRDRLMKKRRKE